MPIQKSDRKKITLQDIYLLYPYKTRKIVGKTVPVPYFPKSEITEHEYSKEYKEWKRCIEILLKNLRLYLLTGMKYRIPNRMGNLQIRKCKSAGLSFAHYRKTGEWKKMDNRQWKGYRPLLKWDRNAPDGTALKFKRAWAFDFTDTAWGEVMSILNKDFSYINRFIDD